MKKSVLLFCLMLTACGLAAVSISNAHAAGFALYEWSSRGNGMGGALTALVDDASAIAYNPSAMTRVEGTQSMAGVTLIQPHADVEMNGETASTKGKVYVPPHAYITHQVNDDLWVGFGAYTRYGVGTNYDHDWEGRYNVYKASLESHSFSPAVAYKVNDKWSVGAAVDAMWLSFDLRKIISPLSPVPAARNADLHLDNTGWAWGGNISTHYQFTDKLSVGAIYRTPQRLVGSGKTKILETGVEEDLTMRATLPGSLTFGLAFEPTDVWRFEVDAIYTNWSDYKQIEYRYGSQTATQAFFGQSQTDAAKHFKNVWRLQVGTEIDINDANTLRLGFVWDQSPIKTGYEDYMLPTNDRTMYSVGYGYKSGDWNVDLSLMYLNMDDRHIDARGNSLVTGIYDTDITGSSAYLGGVSVTYNF
ncbi:OmpP1/FadL family transporter [Salidesulfovibrio onnuriiensis]|uniref:OmpP1/FadL family transporter n=1 Tax=Salidesulfovibrio onnuriiensis TaxID=2583823 RepID=UPI0011C9BC48|nr:OmpP1/FadL family transporter [Salidesulfovibrio onnuriiensis]